MEWSKKRSVEVQSPHPVLRATCLVNHKMNTVHEMRLFPCPSMWCFRFCSASVPELWSPWQRATDRTSTTKALFFYFCFWSGSVFNSLSAVRDEMEFLKCLILLLCREADISVLDSVFFFLRSVLAWGSTSFNEWTFDSEKKKSLELLRLLGVSLMYRL